MRPERTIPSTVAVTLGALLLVLAAVAGPAAATQASPTDVSPSEDTQTDAPDSGAQTDDGNRTAESIVDAFDRRMSSAETLSMTIVSNASSSSYSSSSETTVWVDFENNRSRIERSSDYGETVTVRNESGTVTYNVAENTVSSYNYSFSEQNPGQFGVERLLDNSTVTYEGTETIDGETAYRLAIHPETRYNVSGSYNVTLWVDTETNLPVQTYIHSASDQYSYEVTQRYRNVTVNETIPDERFSIDVPDDAERPEDTGPEFYSYDSESELRSNTTQSVPDPAVPDSYSFDSGYVTAGEDADSVTLTYTTEGNESLTVSKRTSSGHDYSDAEAYDAVSVGNRTGYYNEVDYGGSSISVLVFECDSDRYTVYGSLSERETIDVAESVDCG